MLSSDFFADASGDFRLGEPGEAFIADEPLPLLPARWTEDSIAPLARWLCRPCTRSVSQVLTVLQAIPATAWPTAHVLIAEHIFPAYWTAFKAGDKTERRRLSALRVLIEQEEKRRGFQIQ